MLFEKIKLEPQEKVLKIVRKHWFVIAAELFGIFVMAMIPFFLTVIFAFFPEVYTLLKSSVPNYIPLLTFFSSVWLVLSMMSAFMVWTHYYLDLWIITDRRIIAVDQIHFFNRNVGIFRLERLQDIEVKINGIIPTFLNFGSLNAQTAGHFESNFQSKGMPDPRGLQATIQEAMDSRLHALRGTDVVRHQT